MLFYSDFQNSVPKPDSRSSINSKYLIPGTKYPEPASR
ncbi:hypothetical protein D3OALGB2SA_3027 [Olavius algarvensis associated proteobacterium Delta 3]|nr:hypothetical protein D3OALGB2SA_3027 [Olavius algarvensis associated proteobacterium Delta 3]